MSNANKQLVQRAHAILKDKGHEIPLGHIYELFAQLEGYKDWNTAKAKGVSLQKGFSPLEENELEIIDRMIAGMKAHDEHLRPCPTLHLSIEGRAWVQFSASYTFKKGTALSEELIEDTKRVFLREIENYEALAPADRKVECELITAQGYNDLSAEEIQAERGLKEEEIEQRLNISHKLNIPDLSEYGQIAEGLYKRQARIEHGFGFKKSE